MVGTDYEGVISKDLCWLSLHILSLDGSRGMEKGSVLSELIQFQASSYLGEHSHYIFSMLFLFRGDHT